MSASFISLVATVFVLLVWRVEEIAEACSCAPIHPQQAVCNANVVIKAKVVAQKEVNTGDDTYGNPIQKIQYEIKQIKMFKGPEDNIEYIYTAPSSAICGAVLDTSGKKEYLITGKLDEDGKMFVTLCDFISQWDQLTIMQKKSLIHKYQTECDCKIIRCASTPCYINSRSECLWTDWITEKKIHGTQAKSYACIKRSDNSCAWYNGSTQPKKEFMDAEDP
ncbi:metalloproteinase inhibitor 2a [Rhinoraja longicauda]